MSTEDKKDKEKKSKSDKLIKEKIKNLKKFKLNKKSNYINKGFFTNGFVFVKDRALEDLNDELRVIDPGSDFEKTELTEEMLKKLDEFSKIDFCKKEFTKSSLKKFLKEFKKISLEQIQILPNGKFRWFDDLGNQKFKCVGEADIFKDIYLEFDNKMFRNIIEYFEDSESNEITLYTNRTFLLMKSIEGITIYARGVNLAK